MTGNHRDMILRLRQVSEGRSERGGNLIEYLVLLMGVVVICIMAVRAMGPLNTPAFEDANDGIHGIAPGETSGDPQGDPQSDPQHPPPAE